MNKKEKIAFRQNGRPVTWAEVTTEDLRTTVQNYPNTKHAELSRVELARRGIAF